MLESAGHNLVYVAGPTASGKTDVSIALAKSLNTEIISCDSRQFFKELKIGAAPPTKEQLQAVKHHFIQHLSVMQDYNAGRFGAEAQVLLDQLFKTHKTAIMVGGSGLYANAVLYGFDDLPQANESVRAHYAKVLTAEGLEALQRELALKDPEYFEEVDRYNPHRLIRALEIISSTGAKYSALRQQNNKRANFKTTILVMDVPREELYANINARVDHMVNAGLEEEARTLWPQAHLQTLNTVGYKEWFAHFRGEITRAQTIDLIKQNTRRFAKRQITWFKRYKEAIWVKPDDLAGMMKILNP